MAEKIFYDVCNDYSLDKIPNGGPTDLGKYRTHPAGMFIPGRSKPVPIIVYTHKEYDEVHYVSHDADLGPVLQGMHY